MTRVRIDLFISLDGYTSTTDDPRTTRWATDWGRLTAAYTATRTFRERVFGDTSGAGTTGVDDAYAAAYFEGIGAEIMGAAMFGLHAFPDDPDWKGWWGDEPPFGTPVYVLTHTAPRPSIPMDGRHDVPLPQRRDRGRARRGDARPPAAWTCASAAASAPRATSCAPAWSTTCTS